MRGHSLIITLLVVASVGGAYRSLHRDTTDSVPNAESVSDGLVGSAKNGSPRRERSSLPTSPIPETFSPRTPLGFKKPPLVRPSVPDESPRASDAAYDARMDREIHALRQDPNAAISEIDRILRDPASSLQDRAHAYSLAGHFESIPSSWESQAIEDISRVRSEDPDSQSLGLSAYALLSSSAPDLSTEEIEYLRRRVIESTPDHPVSRLFRELTLTQEAP